MTIYNKKFSRIMANFVPVFGNDNHIRAIKLLKTLSDTDKKLEKKIREMAGLRKLEEEGKSLMKQVIYLLEKPLVDKTGDKTN